VYDAAFATVVKAGVKTVLKIVVAHGDSSRSVTEMSFHYISKIFSAQNMFFWRLDCARYTGDMADDVDEIAMHVLLADPEIDPAVAVAGALVNDSQPAAPERMAWSWFTAGIAMGCLAAVVYFLLQ
jgi:hypothetical protein